MYVASAASGIAPAADSCVVSQCSAPLSSPLDSRQYRACLLPNGLRALVVSDPAASQAGAAMDVAVGHFADPEDLPGLAHFLEHMLFLGTEKYPQEDSYRTFLAQHGGVSNAYTAMEDTNYHFSVVATQLEEALDRFAQFFIAPLFTESATDREMNAVHSEHHKNLQSDSHRLFQLEKSLASTAHPYHKFGTGSRDTLDQPRVRDALLAFHAKWYSANIMHLCVVGPQSLDTLQQWLEDKFTPIRNRSVEIPPAGGDVAVHGPFPDSHGPARIRVTPIKDVRLLSVLWAVPPTRHTYRTKPNDFVAHLLGHEGTGSLLSLLKVRGWVDTLAAGLGKTTDSFSTFEIGMELTTDGVGHEDEILDLVFGYLAMIRGKCVERWVFDEMSATADMTFRFQEREEPLQMATRLSSFMRYFPPERYLDGPFRYFDFDPKVIHEALAYLAPARVRVLSVGKHHENATVEREKWYKTPYVVDPIDPKVCAKWAESATDPELHPPLPNKFIPTDFTILPPPETTSNKFPRVIRADDLVELHYLQDTTFERPKAVVLLDLNSPLAYTSPRNAVLTNLLTSLLDDDLNEFSYNAEIAGLHYGISNTASGMQIEVNGYNHKLEVLLDEIVSKLPRYKVNRDRFEFVRDAVEREYLNFFKEQPYQHAMYANTIAVEVPRWHMREYGRQVKTVTVADVEDFAANFFSRLHIVALVHGNLREETALQMVTKLEELLNCAALPEDERFVRRIAEVPQGPYGTLIQQRGPNEQDTNSAVDLVLQFGLSNLRVSVLTELLAAILSKSFFHELRTVQQLGYLVHSAYTSNGNTFGIRFVIQSTVASPAEVDERVEKYLREFRSDTLTTLSQDDFNNYVQSLITKKLEPEKRLAQRSRRLWTEITRRRYLYEKRQRDVEILKSIKSVEEIVKVFDYYVAREGAGRRKLASHVVAKDVGLGTQEGTDASLVEDVVQFRNNMPLYSARYPTE